MYLYKTKNKLIVSRSLPTYEALISYGPSDPQDSGFQDGKKV